MAAYETVEQIEESLEAAIEVAMEADIGEFAKVNLAVMIDKYVYSYPPGRYKRRYEVGGLADQSNMEAHYDRGSHELSIRQMTQGTRSHSGDILDDLVETGTGYDYGGNAMIPRPFYQPTDELLSGAANHVMDVVLEERLNELV